MGTGTEIRITAVSEQASLSQEEIQGSSCRRQICDLCASSREKRCIEHSMSHNDYKALYTSIPDICVNRVGRPCIVFIN